MPVIRHAVLEAEKFKMKDYAFDLDVTSPLKSF